MYFLSSDDTFVIHCAVLLCCSSILIHTHVPPQADYSLVLIVSSTCYKQLKLNCQTHTKYHSPLALNAQQCMARSLILLVNTVQEGGGWNAGVVCCVQVLGVEMEKKRVTRMIMMMNKIG